MIWKLIFGIGWIGIFFISLAGVFFSVLPAYLSKIPLSPLALKGTIVGVCVFYLILFVEKFSTLFSNDEITYDVTTDEGRIKISSVTINTLVKQTLSQISSIKQLKVKNHMGKKGLHIKLELEVNSSANISGELKKVQMLIRENIKNSLEIEVANVDIITTKINSKKEKNVKRGESDVSSNFGETDNE